MFNKGDAASARKMAINADALCSKCVAPPPVHGLVLRVLADACMGCNEPQVRASRMTLFHCKASSIVGLSYKRIFFI